MSASSYLGQISASIKIRSTRTKLKQINSMIGLGTMVNRPSGGRGYLGGEHPGGTTTVDGVPMPAELRILWRDPSNSHMDGTVVARTHSAADGTWRVVGLNPELRYDVVGRKSGHNDVIQSNVQPTRTDEIAVTSDLETNEEFDGIKGSAIFVGGLPPYSAAIVSALPPGLIPVIDGHKLIIDGKSSGVGIWNSILRTTDSTGVFVDFPITAEIRMLELKFSTAKKTANVAYDEKRQVMHSTSGKSAAAAETEKSTGKHFMEFYSSQAAWTADGFGEAVGFTTSNQVINDAFGLVGAGDIRLIFRRYGGASNGAQVLINGSKTIWISGSYLRDFGYIGAAVDLDANRIWVNINGSWVDGATPKNKPSGWRTFARTLPLVPAVLMNTPITADPNAKIRLVTKMSEFKSVTGPDFEAGGALNGFTPWTS